MTLTKYNFRLCYNAVYFTKSYLGSLKMIQDELGFSSAFIINEEALWAKAIAGITEKWLKDQGWKSNRCRDIPKRDVGFLSAFAEDQKFEDSGHCLHLQPTGDCCLC